MPLNLIGNLGRKLAGGPMAGYSGTPLGKKLGIKPDTLVLLVDMPASVKKELNADLKSARISKSATSGVDLIHAFVTSKAVLKKSLPNWKKSLAKTGSLWISWPKKTSLIETDLSGDLVRELGLASGLVDIKVCAVDNDWSGHKFVFRKIDR
jgi:hypothetical protein